MNTYSLVLKPPIGSRTAIIGTTGAGKSYLAERMLYWLKNQFIAIIDPKGQFPWPGGKIVKTPDTFLRAIHERERVIIYRPAAGFLNDLSAYETVFSAIYNGKNRVTYIDELFLCCRGSQTFPVSLMALFCQGRGLGLTVIWAAQRPRNVPVFCLSESGRIACFQLASPDDRKRVADFSDHALQVKARGHSFFYWERDADNEAIYTRIQRRQIAVEGKTL